MYLINDLLYFNSAQFYGCRGWSEYGACEGENCSYKGLKSRKRMCNYGVEWIEYIEYKLCIVRFIFIIYYSSVCLSKYSPFLSILYLLINVLFLSHPPSISHIPATLYHSLLYLQLIPNHHHYLYIILLKLLIYK